MKLLVTGGLGFIGSNFIIHILENTDYSIVNVDAEFYGSNHNNLANVKNSGNYQFMKGNINDHKLMKKLISECDIIVNFAAESFVDRSIANASPFVESNIKGVFIILDILKELKKRMIHISTDEVFGSLKEKSADENFQYNPSSPYAATKASAELLINSFVITHEVDCVISRCTNNYGPRQFPEKLIPKSIILASQNKKIPIYGNGKNVRDWIYVDDHCNAILKILLDGKSGQSYNISTNNEIDNTTIVKKILDIMDKSHDLIEFVEDRPGHDFRYSMNSTKIRNEFGWKEKTYFEEGIRNTVDWYLTHLDWWKNLSDKVLDPTPWKN